MCGGYINRLPCFQKFSHYEVCLSNYSMEKFCGQLGLRKLNRALGMLTIKKWVNRFEVTGSTINKPKSGRQGSSRTKEYMVYIRLFVMIGTFLFVSTQVLNICIDHHHTYFAQRFKHASLQNSIVSRIKALGFQSCTSIRQQSDTYLLNI